MKLCSQALQGTKSAARAVGIPGIHAGEDVKCDNCQLAKKRIEFESLMKTAKELTRQARDMMVRAATLKSEITHEEAQRRLRLVK